MVHCGLYPSHGALIKTCLKELIKEVCLLRVLGHGTLAWVESPPVLPLGCVIWINCLLEIPFFFLLSLWRWLDRIDKRPHTITKQRVTDGWHRQINHVPFLFPGTVHLNFMIPPSPIQKLVLGLLPCLVSTDAFNKGWTTAWCMSKNTSVRASGIEGLLMHHAWNP